MWTCVIVSTYFWYVGSPGSIHGHDMVYLVLKPGSQNSRKVGGGDRAVERRTVNRGDGGSTSPTAVSKLRQFRSPHICLYLSEKTLKAGGPFYLVSVPGEVKDPTQGVNM